jgi:hypothetical protein
MIAKHRDLPSDKLVLISRSGFSANARKKAVEHNVKPVAFDLLPIDTALSVLDHLGETIALNEISCHVEVVWLTCGQTNGTEMVVEVSASTAIVSEREVF